MRGIQIRLGRDYYVLVAGNDYSVDPAAIAAMIDRIVHHADVITLKGASYRLRGHDTLPSARLDQTEQR